jgi:hypothetical protein
MRHGAPDAICGVGHGSGLVAEALAVPSIVANVEGPSAPVCRDRRPRVWGNPIWNVLDFVVADDLHFLFRFSRLRGPGPRWLLDSVFLFKLHGELKKLLVRDLFPAGTRRHGSHCFFMVPQLPCLPT